MAGDENAKTLKVVGSRPVRPDGVDKVTGRAKFGADLYVPNMLHGRVLRSPHAHARIKSSDTSKAEALSGVKAVITSADFPEQPNAAMPAGEAMINFHDMSSNIMARGKALYDGHAVAAVAATSISIAEAALELIEVDYEVLPHVMEPLDAMEPSSPVLHEALFTDGVDPNPETSANVAKRVQIGLGDVDEGFAQADRIFEGEYNTEGVHQGLSLIHI